MKIQIIEEAEQDLIDGYRFYETQSPGLGEYFVNSLFADIDSLKLYSGVHAMHFGYHRLMSRRFPFSVYYRIQGENTKVYAVLDCRRDPGLIRRRLSELSPIGDG